MPLELETSRRGFLIGVGAFTGTMLITPPAIVRAASIMPVRQHDKLYTYYRAEYDEAFDRYFITLDKSWRKLPFRSNLPERVMDKVFAQSDLERIPPHKDSFLGGHVHLGAGLPRKEWDLFRKLHSI